MRCPEVRGDALLVPGDRSNVSAFFVLVSYDVCEKFVFPLCEYLKNEVVYSDLPRIDAWL